MPVAFHKPFATMLLLALAPCSAARAQQVPDNASTRLVVSQILDSRIYNQMLNAGYVKSHEPQFTLLGNNRYKEYSYALQAGRTYYFLGKCDEDCSDLDLKLFNADGDLLDSDVTTDDYPVVHITAQRSRTVILRVVMARCTAAACWSAVVAGGK